MLTMRFVGKHPVTLYLYRKTGCVEIRQPFDEIKHCHTLKEVDDVAKGLYNWKNQL